MICDWWFKVDCNSAPEHYAESSEQLHRAQRLRQQKLRHFVRNEQGLGTSGELFFRNDARPAESMQKPTVRLPQGRPFRAPNSKINKRMDELNVETHQSAENPDASEFLYMRRGRKGKASEVKDKEIQDTAETSSFVSDKNSFNGYNYSPPEKPDGYQYLPPKQEFSEKESERSRYAVEKSKQNDFLNEPKPFNTRPTVMYASTIAKLNIVETTKDPKTTNIPTFTTSKPQSTVAASSTVTRRGSTTYQSSLKTQNEKDIIASRLEVANSLLNNDFKSTTQSYDSQKINTYSTARKPNGKTKETPFYTPTIPTVRETTPAIISTTQSPSTTTTTTPAPTTTTSIPIEVSTIPTNSEIVKHALEMMESLKDLDIEGVMKEEAEKYMGQREGLEVPPSSGPSALHSLALYFANGDNNNTKRMIGLNNNNSLRQGKESLSTILLSDKTVTKYQELFPDEKKTESTEPTTYKKSESTTVENRLDHSDCNNDLEAQHSKNPILSAAGTPQLREIAQIFTHALSAYLQDPEQFRKILSEIRPTEPTFIQLNEIPRFPGTKEFVRSESAFNIPRATNTGTTVKPDDEIFDFSDVSLSTKSGDAETTTEYFDIATSTEANFITTTYYPLVTETLPPPSSNLADKTPGSRLITENLEKIANEKLNARTSKNLENDFGLPANEINGGLGEATKVTLNTNNNSDDDSYFPEDRGSQSKLSPYGFGVKPENSTPIADTYPTSLADTQAIPLRWGDEITTIEPLETNDFPTVYSDLLPPYDINGTEVFSIPDNDIQAPNEETDEHLQHAQSQSFVSSKNNIYTNAKKSKSYYDYLNYNEELLLGTTNFGEKIITTTEIEPQPTTISIRGHFVTKSLPTTTTSAPETTTLDYSTTTPYPETIHTTLPDNGIIKADSKTTLSYSVFLDPLNINDGLMESDEEQTVTPSPHTYLPNGELSSTESAEISTTHATTQRRGKSSFATTPLTIRFGGDESNVIEPLQRRANEMFGKLNESQADHLMNIMKKAEDNKTVKRLILLLIQTCDGDDHNKTLEESRTALLNALIGMDSAINGNQNEFQIINTRREKSLRQTTTTAPIPVTTYKSPNHEKYASSELISKDLSDAESTQSSFEPTTFAESRINYEIETTTDYQIPTTDAEITTEVPSTTSTAEPTTLPSKSRSRSIDSKPKFRLKSSAIKTSSENVRHQKSLGSTVEHHQETVGSAALEHKHADARALELLRSLYSLASRWGKK